MDVADLEPIARRWARPIAGMLVAAGVFAAAWYVSGGLVEGRVDETEAVVSPSTAPPAGTGAAASAGGAADDPTPDEVAAGPATSAPPVPFVPGIGHTDGSGTFYSTYGARPEALAWMESQRLLFNQPLPDDTPTVDNSPTIARRIDEIVRGQRLYGYGSGFEEGGNAPYMLFVDSDVVAFTEVIFSPARCGGDTWWGWSDAEFEPYINGAYRGADRWGIPLPAGFSMSRDDEDFHVMVYDWRADVMIELWKAMPANLTGRPGIEVCWGGITKDFLSSSQGVYPFPTGVDAAGLTAAGLTITLEDVRRGEIRHAIGVSTEIVVNDGGERSFSYPANRNDGLCADDTEDERAELVTAAVGGVDHCLFEGQYLRLPADFDVASIEHPFARMVARAGRDYGFVVHDVAGCFCLQSESSYAITENGLAADDPWLEIYDGADEWEIMWQIDWSQLEVLPPDWNRPADHRIACAVPPGHAPDSSFPMSADTRCEVPGDPYIAG